MKILSLLLCAGALWAQSMPAPSPITGSLPNLPDEEVVATFTDGSKITMGDVKAVYGFLSPVQQQAIIRDPAEFLRQWDVMRRLSAMAVEEKLDQQAPYKQAIEQNRLYVLYQATVSHKLDAIVIEPADITKHYEANKVKYSEVKVKAIYIAYSDNPSNTGKKVLSEAEAKTKAAKLLTQIRSGADFTKLVKENSDDETSREKNGDFATIHYGDNIPDAFSSAIFKLKQGETTEPLKQPNGYYLLRADEVTVKPLAQVRDQIYNDLKNNRMAEWVAQLNRESKVQMNPKLAPTKK